MGEPAPLILRARVVLPVRQPPIENGAVIVSRRRIVKAGPWRQLQSRRGKIFDLGEVILLPGLVNAHCHLDYTNMAGLFRPQKSFCDWIKLITTEKSNWTYSDYAESWLHGAHMLLQSGTTTVADIEAVPELLPDLWDATPLRIISLLEMTGIRSRRDPKAILAEAEKKIRSLKHRRCRAGISPHAPYSTLPELMRRSATLARRHNWPVTTHVGESATEFEMFTRGGGEMFEWLQRSEREMSDCDGVSPVRHLHRCGALGPNLVAAHVNYLCPGDATLLARKRVSVVHCPRSHDYFGHKNFPRTTLMRAGVNICLGTDSLATVRKHPRSQLELNLFHEMRMFAEKNPDVSSRQIVAMATINGARALGLVGKIGEISHGANADLIVLPFAGKTADVYEAVVHHAGRPSASMIDGEWVITNRDLDS